MVRSSKVRLSEIIGEPTFRPIRNKQRLYSATLCNRSSKPALPQFGHEKKAADARGMGPYDASHVAVSMQNAMDAAMLR
jgi:hypothetical protein